MTRFRREPRTLFARCGMLVYGDSYVTPLSRALMVSDRTVQRWSSGSREVPPDIWNKLLAMLQDEGARLYDASQLVLEHQWRQLEPNDC